MYTQTQTVHYIIASIFTCPLPVIPVFFSQPSNTVVLFIKKRITGKTLKQPERI